MTEIRGNGGNLKSAVKKQKVKMGDERSKEARKQGRGDRKANLGDPDKKNFSNFFSIRDSNFYEG